MEYRIFYQNTVILEDPYEYEKQYSLMPKYRREKIDKMKFDKDKRLSLGAGILLRKALELYGYNGKEGEISTGENGKPYYKNLPDFHFNLTHSNELCGMIVSDTECGIDIEYIKEYNEKIPFRFYTERERELLSSIVSEKDRRRMFYRIWTMKESVMKASGNGLLLSPTEIETVGENGKPVKQLHCGGKIVFIKEINKCEDYAITVAITEE